MAIKVIKADSRAWRPYRFPPRCATASADNHGWDSDPAARQRAISEGFQEGLEKGYQDGVGDQLPAYVSPSYGSYPQPVPFIY